MKWIKSDDWVLLFLIWNISSKQCNLQQPTKGYCQLNDLFYFLWSQLYPSRELVLLICKCSVKWKQESKTEYGYYLRKKRAEGANSLTYAGSLCYKKLDLIPSLIAISNLSRNATLTNQLEFSGPSYLGDLSHGSNPFSIGTRSSPHDITFACPFTPKRFPGFKAILSFLLLIASWPHPSSYKSISFGPSHQVPF